MQMPHNLPLFNSSDWYISRNGNPLPMQYLGSKARISPWLLDQIQARFPQTTTFLDAFAGTGSVSLEASGRGYRSFLNDIQPYAFVILTSLFVQPREGLVELASDIEELKSDQYLLADGRAGMNTLLEKEREHFRQATSYGWKWEEYRDFCESTALVQGSEDEVAKLRDERGWNLFSKYYANTYFGVEQCLQLDTLREFADKKASSNSKIHILAATITAMTYAVSSTTHLAQYLKPNSKKQSQHLISRRRFNLVDEVIKRLTNLPKFPLPAAGAHVYQLDFRDALQETPLDEWTVVYVDPPYFKEHYSRYYHVLDTFYLYDYPALTFNERIEATTIGRYRQDRVVSDFGLKKSVPKAFSDLFAIVKSSGAKLAISYANTSLVRKTQLIQLAEEAGFNTDLREIQLMHSGQGQPRNKTVTEYLFLLESE